MRKLLLAISFTILVVAPVRAEEINLGDLQVVEHFSMTPGTQAPAILTAPYSNVTTFLGQGYVNGGAALQGASTITRLVADDCTPTGAYAGLSVTQLKFSVANFNPAATTARARVRFWNADGPAGAPSTYDAQPANVGFSFNPIAFGPGVAVLTGTIGAGLFNMPAGTLWAGITFDNDNGTTGATAADLNNLGQGVFDPPTAGTLLNLGGTPIASFGWEFTVDAPVPTEDSGWGRVKAQYRN